MSGIADIAQRLRSDWYGKPSDAVLDHVMEEGAAEIDRLRSALSNIRHRVINGTGFEMGHDIITIVDAALHRSPPPQEAERT